jgi:hypothetical protein
MSGDAPVTRDEAEVLSYLVDDHYGLWEVLGIFGGDRTRACGVVATLLARGWVQLFRQRDEAEFAPLSSAEIEACLASETAWQVPPESCWITTTPGGDAVYFALPVEFFAFRLGGG